MRIESEADIQRTCVEWCRLFQMSYPGLELIHANLNGAMLNGTAEQRARRWKYLERQGALPGVFDLFLPVARKGYHGLYIEAKRASPKGRLSSKQEYWMTAVSREGYKAVVCYSSAQFIQTIKDYYHEEPP